jgi:hypothetical protein
MQKKRRQIQALENRNIEIHVRCKSKQEKFTSINKEENVPPWCKYFFRPVTPSTKGAGYADVSMAGSKTICSLKGRDLTLGLHAEYNDGRYAPIGAGTKKALATHAAAMTRKDRSIEGFRTSFL